MWIRSGMGSTQPHEGNWGTTWLRSSRSDLWSKMMITLSSRISICQSVAEVWLNDVASLEAVSHRFNFTTVLTDLLIYYRASFASDQVPQCESELTAGCVRVLGSAPYCSRSCTNFMFLLYTASSKLENGTSQLFGSAPCFRSFSIMVSVHINLKLH
jgi:hypothetical protein